MYVVFHSDVYIWEESEDVDHEKRDDGKVLITV